MSKSTKSSSFPKTIGIGRSVFPGLLRGAAALNQPGLLSSGVTSSRGANSDKLSFATFIFRGFTSLATTSRAHYWHYMGSTDVIGPVGISTRSGAYSS